MTRNETNDFLRRDTSGVHSHNQRRDVCSDSPQVGDGLQLVVAQLSVETKTEGGRLSRCDGGCLTCVRTHVLTFHSAAAVWKTEWCRAPAACCGSGPCEGGRRGAMKGRRWTMAPRDQKEKRTKGRRTKRHKDDHVSHSTKLQTIFNWSVEQKSN